MENLINLLNTNNNRQGPMYVMYLVAVRSFCVEFVSKPHNKESIIALLDKYSFNETNADDIMKILREYYYQHVIIKGKEYILVNTEYNGMDQTNMVRILEQLLKHRL